MRTGQQLADNRIGRQFSPSPLKGRLPLADHGTECLAWSLRKGDRFGAALLKFLGRYP
ncbi:MAG TPA: hypothetical protein VMB21_20415 [Candidatus Limnocylindria bacterium]|nr:hypothetical protein [Candidatus Limnocylindria bacterium]